jgi:hypothetical protein
MDIQIRVEGVEELVAKLTKLEQLKRVKKQVRAEGTVLRGKMAAYPTRVHSKNPLIQSDPRVRRGFFYHLKHGDIGVPYKRTYKLRDNWKVASEGGGWTVKVSVAGVSYAPLVQGWEEQVTQHKWSGWLTDKGAMNVYGPGIKQRITQALEQEVANV